MNLNSLSAAAAMFSMPLHDALGPFDASHWNGSRPYRRATMPPAKWQAKRKKERAARIARRHNR